MAPYVSHAPAYVSISKASAVIAPLPRWPTNLRYFFLEVNFPHASCALENARLNRGADARATCVHSDVAYGASFSAAPDDLLEGVVRAAPFSCLWSDM